MGGIFGGGGGGSTVVNEAPDPLIVRRIDAPGFVSTTTGPPDNLQVQLTRNPIVDDLLTNFRTNQQSALDELRGLRGLIEPGVSQLRQVQLNALDDARFNAIGNLRDNLARRRILGSSFANDSLSRAEAEFGKARSQIEAQSTLQELGLTAEFINQELGLEQQALATELDQLNFEAGLTQGVAAQGQGALNQASAIAAQNSRLNAQIALQQQQGSGEFLGTLLGLGLGAFGFGGAFGTGGAFSSLFAPASAGTAASSAFAVAPGFVPSDIRYKTNIKRIKKRPNGIHFYKYHYVGKDTYEVGVMAQEVERVIPEAVMEIDGVKTVNYERVV